MVQLNLAYQGVPLDQARAALLMVHGRGASAADILTLASELEACLPDSRLAFVAPQAPGNTWYPYPFMSPIQQNEPHLSGALQTIADTLASLEKAGLPPKRWCCSGSRRAPAWQPSSRPAMPAAMLELPA